MYTPPRRRAATKNINSASVNMFIQQTNSLILESTNVKNSSFDAWYKATDMLYYSYSPRKIYSLKAWINKVVHAFLQIAESSILKKIIWILPHYHLEKPKSIGHDGAG